MGWAWLTVDGQSPWLYHGGFLLKLNSDFRLQAYFSEQGGTGPLLFAVTSPTPVTTGADAWHHFALIWEDDAGVNSTGLASLYLDQQLVAAASAPVGFDSAKADLYDISGFLIGARSAAANNMWDGRLDEFRFTRGVLSPQQFLVHVPEPAGLALAIFAVGMGLTARHRRRRRGVGKHAF